MKVRVQFGCLGSFVEAPVVTPKGFMVSAVGLTKSEEGWGIEIKCLQLPNRGAPNASAETKTYNILVNADPAEQVSGFVIDLD